MPSYFRHPALASAVLLIPALAISARDLVWPITGPNPLDGDPVAAFVQPTNADFLSSGLFGCVRNDGRRFHEGIDIRAVTRDRKGEPADTVVAIMAGTVVYLNLRPSASSYGRYLVIEHPHQALSVHSLYAHLARINSDLEAGSRVQPGRPIGTLGRSASTHRIAKGDAHLHLEIGFRLSNRFQAWYDGQPFEQENVHGHYNGLNLVGIDPLVFYEQYRLRSRLEMLDLLADLPLALTLRISFRGLPDFLRRYRALTGNSSREIVNVAGWDVSFTPYGVPLRWTPLSPGEDPVLDREGNVSLLNFNPGLLGEASCRELINQQSDRPDLGPGARQLIELLFGFH